MQKTWFNSRSTALPRLERRSPRRRLPVGWLRPFLSPVILLAVLLGVWLGVTESHLVRSFLIPHPGDVAAKFYRVATNGDPIWQSTLWRHTQTTLKEVLLGLSAGLPLGMVLGYLIAKSRWLDSLLSPVIVVFQSTPIVAYAPLLVIWFGNGIASKVLTCALIVFFPMLMNTVVGLRNVPEDWRDLLRVCQANRWQMFTKLELPAALPVLLTGLKTGVALAVIGAVVGEFVAANSGLGFLINLARQQFDTPLVYVGILTLALITGTLYGLASLLERRLLAWQRRG